MSEWERAAPLLEAALRRSGGQLGLGNVAQALTEGEATLWLGDRSAGVTEPINACGVWLFGGALREMPGMLAALEDEARAQGRDQIIVWGGRSGWQRVLQHHGFERRSALVKEVGGGR